MKRWLRRLAHSLILLVWFLFISLPIVAFALANRGQLQLGGPQRHVRLFLVQEREVEGVGVEWTRPYQTRNQVANEAPDCSRTSINYLTWRGEGENVVYCQCYAPDGDHPLASGPDVCP